jgi:hypothetical protein
MGRVLAIGMTVGVRVNKEIVYDYCQQAVHSLREAGFPQVLHLFLEPGAARHIPEPRKKLNLCLHQNEHKLGCFKNFCHGLRWLYENTEADWLLMLQDDAVWRKDGWSVMEKAINTAEFHDVGFLSPYTSKSMVNKVAKGRLKQVKRNRKVWENWEDARFHNRAFWGAVAMCFPREAARRLEHESKRYRTHKHHRKLDVVVGNAVRHELQLAIKVHVPSLVDHIGSWSTLGRHRFRGNQWGRRGFLFRVK